MVILHVKYRPSAEPAFDFHVQYWHCINFFVTCMRKQLNLTVFSIMLLWLNFEHVQLMLFRYFRVEFLQVTLYVKKHVLFWISLPCIDNVGSCSYDDVCQLISQFPCPPPFQKYGIPCRCPVAKVSWNVVVWEFLNRAYCFSSASEMTYIVSSGALNSTHSLLFQCFDTKPPLALQRSNWHQLFLEGGLDVGCSGQLWLNGWPHSLTAWLLPSFPYCTGPFGACRNR